MNETWNALSAASRSYLERVERGVCASTGEQVAERIRQLADDAEELRRRRCLNLNAAESSMSFPARQLLDRDLATRVSEGPPGDRIFPRGHQNDSVDELEAIVIAQARALFRAEFVEWRATSTTMTNLIALFALTKPGETILVQSMEGGGNMSYHDGAIPTIRGLRVREMPIAGDAFEIDVDGARRIAHETRPAMLIVGGSYVLFPYPVRALREIADEIGATFLYDAAHTSLLVAEGGFQDPLVEGAHLMTMSTHKIMGGPVGGLILTNDSEMARRLWEIPFPPLMQTRDQNKYAATAYALTEMAAFGNDYARQVVANARALAQALTDVGFTMIARDRGFTATHQIFIDATAIGARQIEDRVQACNMLFQASHMRGDGARGVRTGLRLSVQEVTRQGMREAEMGEIAVLVRRAVFDNESPVTVARDVERLATRFALPQFTFAPRQLAVGA